MLVFLNQTCYNRFWDGRNALSSVIAGVRSLVRVILTVTYADANDGHGYGRERLTESEKEDIEKTVRVLIALPIAIKDHLRGEWCPSRQGILYDSEARSHSQSYSQYQYQATEQDYEYGSSSSYTLPNPNLDPELELPNHNAEYETLLPANFEGKENIGLGLPYQLTFLIDSFIKRAQRRKWFSSPEASTAQGLLNKIQDAFGDMETIMLTPLPVAHLYFPFYPFLVLLLLYD